MTENMERVKNELEFDVYSTLQGILCCVAQFNHATFAEIQNNISNLSSDLSSNSSEDDDLSDVENNHSYKIDNDITTEPVSKDLFSELYNDFDKIMSELNSEPLDMLQLPDTEKLLEFGNVHSIVDDNAVVISSFPSKPALGEGSILFNVKREPIGPILEIFGQVTSPLYVILLSGINPKQNKNSKLEARKLKVNIDEIVYFVPYNQMYTHCLFPSQLAKIKGSDASWQNDVEPPPEFQDFSDDEKEREHKKQLKKSKNPPIPNDQNQVSSQIHLNKNSKKKNYTNNELQSSNKNILQMIENLSQGKCVKPFYPNNKLTDGSSLTIDTGNNSSNFFSGNLAAATSLDPCVTTNLNHQMIPKLTFPLATSPITNAQINTLTNIQDSNVEAKISNIENFVSSSEQNTTISKNLLNLYYDEDDIGESDSTSGSEGDDERSVKND